MSAQVSSKPNLSQAEIDAAVAVVGLGAHFPGRPGLAGYWSVIKNGIDTMTDIPPDHFLSGDYYDPDPKARDRIYVRKGAFLSPVPFEPLKYGISPKEMESTDTTQLLGLLVADQALNDAGYPADKAGHSRTAVILGVTGALKMVVSLGSRLAHPQLRRALEAEGVAPDVALSVLERFADSFQPWTESSFPGLLGNVTAGRIASRLNLHGENLAVDAACASSLAAVSQAILALRSKRCDMVVSGGVDTFNDPFMFSCFSKTPALSRTGEARAFDQAGDGTMLGEGIGVVLLKRLSDALRDGDKVYAVVRSVGGASDGRGTAIFAPSAKGQGRALEAAYAEAGFDPSTVELVEAHGTGTVVGDQVELSALSEFFTQHSGHADDASGDNPSGTLSAGRLPWCALGSVKSQIGHTKAAAGVAGLIKAILSLYYKVLPPSIHLKEPLEPLKSPGCPFYVSGEARPWISSPRHPRRAGVSAFGFGGSNFHCLLEEAGEVKTPFETGVHLAPFSANSLSRLVKAVRDLTEEARLSLSQEEAGDPRFRQDYFSQALDARLRPLLQGYDGNASEKVFVAFEAKSARDFMETLPEILLAHSNGTGIYGLPDGLFFGKAKNDGRKLVFHDPGDLPLRTGQGQGLALDFAHYHMILDHFAQGWVGSPLGLLLYPPKLLPEGAQDFLLRELRDPSSGYFLGPALSLALYELYSFFGIRSDLVAGSGPGLVSALLISGWLPIQEAVRSLGKLPAGKDPSLLRDALNGLSLFAPDRDAAPKDKAKPVLVTENGDPVQDVEEARKLLLEGLDRDIAALSDAGTPAAPSTKPPFPGMLVISAGELPFPKGEGDIPTAELARFVQNPRDTLGLARNLARLASLGVGVEFRKWSYNSYPSPRPQGHSVPLGGANLFEANGNKKGANGDAAPAKPGATSAAQAQALGDAARLRDLEGRIDKLSLAQEKTLALLEGMRESIAGLAVPVLQSVPVAPVVQSGQSGQPGQPNQITATETSQSPAAKRTGPGNGGEAYRPTELPVSPNPRLRSLAEGSPGRGNGGGETKARETKARDNKAQPNAQTGSLRAKDVRLDYVWEILSDLVARETGYPQESLDPSLDLEGDLGLDSIKRVELLSEIANAFPGAEGHLVANTLGELMDICERSLAFAEGPSEDLDEEYLSLSPQSPAGNPSQGLAEDTPIGNGGSLLAGNAAGAAYDPAATKDPLAAYTSLSVDSPPKRTFLRSQGSKALPQRGEIQDNPNYIPQDITDDDITDDDMTYDDIPADDITYDDITDDDITHDDITDDDIPAAVLSLISRETGYPVSSLGKGLSLEGDLGLDSIKKVEILSLLSDILRECDPASLTQAETIGDILNLAIASDFGQEPYYEDASQEWPQTTQGAGTPYPEPSPWQAGQGQWQSQGQDQSQGQWQSQGQGQSQGQSREQSQAAENLVLGIVARETGFPIESLKRELALESDLGLDSIKKVELLSALTEEALAKGLLAELGPISQGRLAQAQSLGEWVDFFANPT
ncbi:MAG: phosphopantetheine-binding protein, partial [Deltaproteobacteria bacterium]|nr:phosphopantetheine-binding protein [Deltaproteobacteria bacterium]